MSPLSNAGKPNGPGRAGLGHGWRVLLFVVLLSLLLSAVLTVPILPGAVGQEFRVGFPAPYTVKSPVTIRYVSEILTRSDEDAAAAAVPDVYRFDPDITLRARQSLSNTLGLIETILFELELDHAERIDRIAQVEDVQFSSDSLTLFGVLQEWEWPPIAQEALRLYDEVTRADPDAIRRIGEEDVDELREGLAGQVQSTFYPLKRNLISELVAPFVLPNEVVDEAETIRRREEARVATPPHYVEVLRGEVIIYEGQILRDTHLEKLEAVGLHRPAISWPEVMGHVILVLGMVGSFGGFLYRFERRVVADFRSLLLIGLVAVVALVGAKLLVPERVGLAYAFPLPTASILLTLLLGPQVALAETIVLAVLVGPLAGNSLELVALGIVGGLVAVLSIWKAQRTNVFLYTGFYISLANIAVVGAFRFIAHDIALPALLTAATACAINGFFSAAFSFATFGLLGTLFGKMTVLQLMELANPNHPLLRRLMSEAPGTYYHSIMVGNLAERAAEAIGADPLLARVGAYYHDVGKLIRPYFFVDNQAGRSNIHDELPPRTSAQIITDHVHDGIALARKYRLPEQIVQFIPQHHGTAMATYFYRRALQEDEKVDPADFAYPGPKPQSREAAILMVADSVEATVRAMDQSGKLKELLESAQEGEDPLAKLVSGIIDERIRAGQFNECDLTFRDLKAIEHVFAQVLRGIYHPRVSYPEVGKPREAPS